MEHKKGKLRSLIDNREKMQKEAAVDGPPTVSSVQDILNLLGSVGHGNDAASADGKGDDSSSSSSSSSNSDSSDEHAAHAAVGAHKTTLGNDVQWSEARSGRHEWECDGLWPWAW